MTKPPGDDQREEHLLEALQNAWKSMDDTFPAEPASLPDWTAFVRESKRASKRRLWKELAILWALAVPILGVLLMTALGLSPVFWIIQALAAVAGIWLAAGEFRKSSRTGGKGTAP